MAGAHRRADSGRLLSLLPSVLLRGPQKRQLPLVGTARSERGGFVKHLAVTGDKERAYEGADDPWCYSGVCAGGRESGSAGVQMQKGCGRAGGFPTAGQGVWGFTLHIATLWNILRDDSHTFMTWLSPSVFCQKTLNRHEGLFPGIWGSEEGRSEKAVSRSATSLGGTLRCRCRGHSFGKDGAGGSPCYMSVGRGEPGLGMKRRPLSLSLQDRQTDTPPPSLGLL